MQSELSVAVPIDSLIADISASFPEMLKRRTKYFDREALEVGGELAFADGEPIFPYIAPDDESYDGFIHVGFVEWLDARGWVHEMHEPGLFLLLPGAGQREQEEGRA